LRVEGDGSFVSYWWKRADSGALRVWLRENAESWTVDTSTGATDLRMTIDYSAATASLTPFTPDRVQTDQTENGRSCRWTLKVNWPAGDISFSSTGFTQTLTGEPVISTAQGLEPTQRTHYIAMRELAASHPERGDFTVSVCIGQPRCTGVDEWECAVGLPALHSSLRGQQGVNAFQALMLAQNLARTLLLDFVSVLSQVRSSSRFRLERCATSAIDSRASRISQVPWLV
jgi:hypothetical protein